MNIKIKNTSLYSISREVDRTQQLINLFNVLMMPMNKLKMPISVEVEETICQFLKDFDTLPEQLKNNPKKGFNI